MRTASMAVLFLLGSARVVLAQDAIAPETVAEIKRATVYVKVKVQGREGSGSGFVIRSEGGAALIVTNHHVIEPKVVVEIPGGPPVRPFLPPGAPGIPLPPSWNPRWIETTLKNAVVTVVVNSGAKEERTLNAEVLAIDAQRDLAILRVQAKDLAKAIDISKMPKLAETMPVYSFGFPFGNVLATNKGNPAITVGKAAISSLRNNEDGELALVQIDGSLNPGNSGGPIVDIRGRLVGVAVATIRNSSGIGLAIPAADVQKMLQGRVGAVHLTRSGANQKIRIEVAVVDPLDKVTDIKLYCLPASEVRDPARKIALLDKEPGVRAFKLVIEKQLAVGEMTLDGDARNAEFLFQARYANAAGKDQRTKVLRERVGLPPLAKGKRPVPPVKKAAPVDGATKVFGGSLRDDVVRDEAPEGGILIGLEIGYGSFATKQSITSVRAIFRTKNAETFGRQFGPRPQNPVTIKAKDGYAVGGLSVHATLPIFGLSVNFMRVKGDQLDLDDSYLSRWFGTKSNRQTLLAGDGAPIVGIAAKTNSRGECSGLGLLLKRAIVK